MLLSEKNSFKQTSETVYTDGRVLDVTRVLCNKTKEDTVRIFILNKTAILLVFVPPIVVEGRRPLPPKITVQRDPHPSKNVWS